MLSHARHCTARKTLSAGFGSGRQGRKPTGPLRGRKGERSGAQHADRVIVTDDNPRSEDPSAIRREIIAAAPQAIEIGDRGEAIRQAVAALGAGDLLLIAGKGHETGQIVANKVFPFDDAEVARAAVSALKAGTT